MPTASPVKYKQCPLGSAPFGKIFTLTQPNKNFVCSGKNPDLWFRGLPNNLVPTSAKHFGQCIRINGATIDEHDKDTPVFLLSNVFPHNHNDRIIMKMPSDLTDTQCIMRNGSCWIIIKDPYITENYNGFIIADFTTGRFTLLARNLEVQSADIALTGTRQY